MKVKNQTTIDDLAMMIKRSFGATASKEDLHIIEQDMGRQFAGVNDRLDRIEKIFMVDHKHRIERLEFEVNNLKDLFALK